MKGWNILLYVNVDDQPPKGAKDVNQPQAISFEIYKYMFIYMCYPFCK